MRTGFDPVISSIWNSILVTLDASVMGVVVEFVPGTSSHWYHSERYRPPEAEPTISGAWVKTVVWVLLERSFQFKFTLR